MKAVMKRHYHWVIALIVLLEMFVYVGILNNINGLYVIPVSETLGISRAGAYQLLHSEGFPTLRICKRMLVPRDKLAEWIEKNTAQQEFSLKNGDLKRDDA